jgi:hypothetical protein
MDELLTRTADYTPPNWFRQIREMENETHPLATSSVQEARPQVDWEAARQRVIQAVERNAGVVEGLHAQPAQSNEVVR